MSNHSPRMWDLWLESLQRSFTMIIRSYIFLVIGGGEWTNSGLRRNGSGHHNDWYPLGISAGPLF